MRWSRRILTNSKVDLNILLSWVLKNYDSWAKITRWTLYHLSQKIYAVLCIHLVLPELPRVYQWNIRLFLLPVSILATTHHHRSSTNHYSCRRYDHHRPVHRPWGCASYLSPPCSHFGICFRERMPLLGGDDGLWEPEDAVRQFRS